MARATVHTAGWTWSAVAGGVVAALVMQVILVMIGFGAGLVSIDPSSSAETATWLVFAWWIMSGIFAAAVGGWVAGMLSPTRDEGLKGIGGLAAWAVATLIVVAASGFAAGTSATAVSALGGPAAAARQTLMAAQDAAAQPPGRRETVGQRMTISISADEARRQLAAAMLISAIGLILGGAAAYFAGRMSPDRRFLEEG